MAWCIHQFQAFNEKLRLDKQRQDRVNGAISRFAEFCESDVELRAALASAVFVQGSAATKTVIKPIANAEFDVDIVYPFDLIQSKGGTSPAGAVSWFQGRLAQSDFYKSRLIAKNRCARINYAGDFHLDIAPATASIHGLDPYAVPAKDLGTWKATDPLGFARWVLERDARSGGRDDEGVGRFVRCVRFAKRWRDQFFAKGTAPTSIMLVTMLGNHDPTIKEYNPPIEVPLYPEYQTDAAYLFDMLRLTHSCLLLAKKSAFAHPTLPSEDLSRGWDADHLQTFLTKLKQCIDALKFGIYAENEERALRHYRDAFGATFPTE